MRFVLVAGARPNFVKVKPVLDALEGRDASVILVHTGQHYDQSMSKVLFDDLGLRRPDHHLGVGSGSHADQTARVMTAFEPLLARIEPEAVVVFGDVNSTLASAITTAKCGLLVAHVEAGLRSRDWSMPEEVNRVVTDRVSDYLFAPSPDASENLRSEGCRHDQIHLVGNVMIDSLFANLERARARPILDELGLAPKRYGLVTLHRPGNVDDPSTLTDLFQALGVVTEDCPLVFPIHPRTRMRLERSQVPDGLRLVEPMGYLDFLALEDSAKLVITDSGGVQEETTVLGVPCLTVRDSTERPITISEGTNRLVGRDRHRIVAAARDALAGRVPARRPQLWDGRAAPRIAEVLVRGPGGGRRSRRSRPTQQPGTEPR